jgi:alpha-L-fucosidase 2
LEGNFAAAAGLQEMLLQSYSGTIRIFPAIPPAWKDVSFKTLRAEGAFLITAERAAGVTERVEIVSEKGGLCRIEDPFGQIACRIEGAEKTDLEERNGEFIIMTRPGQKVTLIRKGR